MPQFEAVIAEWPEDKATEFMRKRKEQAHYICVEAQDQEPFYPFYRMNYVHRAAIPGRLPEDYAERTRAMGYANLIPVDPFTPSPLRQRGLLLWDAVAGIPASAIRPPRIVKTRMLATNRNTNAHWIETMMPALGRVGRLVVGGEYLRPRGPFIYDLMYDPLGWRMLEGAHALAHRVAEMKPAESKKRMLYAGSTHFHVQRFLALMCVCRAYGLPLDVWRLDDDPGTPNVRQYGIDVKTSSYFRTPILKLTADNREAPKPDETLALVSTGVFIEPHPHGVTTGTGNWKEVNRWSCSPTVVLIAGWELMDVVSHQSLCATDPDDKSEPICYGMSPADLQGPDTFGAYLRFAAKNRGMPEVDGRRYWFVEDWLNSQDFKNAVDTAPPLPCWGCMRLNMKADGAPRRPEGKPPRRWEEARADRPNALGRPPKAQSQKPGAKVRVLTKTEQEWTDWEQELIKMWHIIEAAVVYYEGKKHGHTRVKGLRAARRAGYRKRLESLHRIQRLSEAAEKALKNGMPSEARRLRAERDALLAECYSERNNECCQSESTLESQAVLPPSVP